MHPIRTAIVLPLFVPSLLLSLATAGSAVAQSASAPAKVYVCPPCPSDCHNVRYDKPGRCPVCNMRLVEQDSIRNVAILIWDGVELLDFAGPGEVFAAATVADAPVFRVFTVAPRPGPVVSQGFVKIEPTYTIDNCPPPHVLVIPGGASQRISEDAAAIAWVKRASNQTEMILTVCTGAFVLAKAGLLDRLEATTWYGAIDRLRSAAPNTIVLADRRYVDNGDIITTAGVSAGIDGALHAVARMLGYREAVRTAEYMEYRWNPDPFAAPAAGAGASGAAATVGEPPRGAASAAGGIGKGPAAARSAIAALGYLLETGEFTVGRVLSDPRFIDLHEEAAFRAAIREHASDATATLVPPDEPGEPLVVRGVVRDDKLKPVPRALVYVYHTNASGVYSSRGGNFGSMGDSLNPRLFAYLRTDNEGRYEFRTIKPGHYPNDGPPAHVHFEVRARGFRELVTEMMFEDDARLTPAARKQFEEAGFAIVPNARGPDGVIRVICDLVLTRR